jgi:hypothetical protein
MFIAMWISKKEVVAGCDVCIQTALEMVNKTRMGWGEVVQLCKGGCQNIPALVSSDVRP